MYAILNNNLALRSWSRQPNALIMKDKPFIRGISLDEAYRLLMANAEEEMPEDELQKSLLSRNWIKECKKGEFRLTDWQKYRRYENRSMIAINLQITGKCNYNCKHCFNAADNAPLQTELSLAQIEDILDQALSCGIYSVLLTGGEPMLHKDFSRILDAVYARGMNVFELNTNGAFMNQPFLDQLKRLGASPLIKISFDGLGFHDWMRGVKGAEEKALDAMRLAISNGFSVMAQINLNSVNQSSIPETLDLLDQMGVSRSRIIRTTESPRWVKNAAGRTLGIEEYYQQVIHILSEYIKKPHRMGITSWEFVSLYPDSKTFSFGPLLHMSPKEGEVSVICPCARGMCAIGSNGEVYPCMQMSGEFERLGIHLGNVFQDGLKQLLTDSRYLDCITQSTNQRAEQNKRCRTCRFFRYCGCGCPALSMANPAFEGSMMGYDQWKCVFFYERYDKKCESAFTGYRNTTPISIEEN